jgi:hypothetical protein
MNGIYLLLLRNQKDPDGDPFLEGPIRTIKLLNYICLFPNFKIAFHSPKGKKYNES